MAETSEDPEDPEDEFDPRGDHFATRRAVFLKELARTSSVKGSAKKAKIPNSTLYLWRENDPDFAAAWLKALAAGYELLEMEMLARARKGVKRKIYYHGEKVATVRDYDNKMGLNLLRLHKETVALERAARAQQADEAAEQAEPLPEPVRDTLDEKLKKVNERLRAYQAGKLRNQECLEDGRGGIGGAAGKSTNERNSVSDGT